jgi:NitT/TauT family transport system substrate-binding protein
MPKNRWLAAAAAAVVALTGCANNASTTTNSAPTGGAGSGPTVTIMVGGLSKQIYLPFMLAQRLGYYQQEGLNVVLQDEGAGVDATEQMLAGKVDGSGGFFDHTIALQGLGQSAESVVSMLSTPGEVELCRNDLKEQIKSPADWKGRTLGVTDLGSSTDYLTQFLAKKNGVDPTQIHRLGVQAGATLIGAMTHKNVDCAMTTEPTVSQLLANNQAYILVDMRNAAGTAQALGGEYPATCLYMMTTYVQSHQDIVQKLVNAYVKTLTYIQGHSAADITDQMPADYYSGVGKDAYIQALNNEKGIYNPTGVMPPNGPPTNLSVLSSFNKDVMGKKIDLSKTYTDQFVKGATG